MPAPQTSISEQKKGGYIWSQLHMKMNGTQQFIKTVFLKPPLKPKNVWGSSAKQIWALSFWWKTNWESYVTINCLGLIGI